MPTTTYVARRPGPFSALVQASEIGGLRLEPHPPVRVLDRFYDTDDGELLRRGLVLRVREQGGRVTAGLRPVEGPADAAADTAADLDLPADVGGPGPLRLPPSALADTVATAVGDDPLRPLLAVRQYRTPRMAYDGDAAVGVVSFDVVVYEGGGARVVSNEVDVEPTRGADPLARLAPVFGARGLERTERSKAARGILHLRRPLGEAVLLLPDERRALEVAVASADSGLRRRAHVILLDARGFRPDTIAAQTGLSMLRVREWREQFRAVRLGLLDPHAPAAAPLPHSPVAEPAPDLSPDPEPARPPAGVEGDGLSLGADVPAADIDDLLDLFTPSATDTPLLGDLAGADDDAFDLADRGTAAEPPDSPLSRDPYPVVLGPARSVATDEVDAFAEVDLSALRSSERARSVARTAAITAARSGRSVPSRVAEASDAASEARPALDGDTPLLAAAQAMVAHAIADFDARAERFLTARTPSAARRLLVAAHGLRLAVETFEAALPTEAARRLVTALRPLVSSLDAALDAARTAAALGGGPAHVLRATNALSEAAERLAGTRHGWGARARRIVARLASQSADGAVRSDDAPLVDDFVGAPGDAPSPTRLRHVVGSAVWSRFEAVRAFEDELDRPTPQLASHLAVALSGLRYVVGLVEPSAGEAASAVSAELADAERRVVEARQRHERGEADALGVLTDVWSRVTARPFKKRIAAVVVAV